MNLKDPQLEASLGAGPGASAQAAAMPSHPHESAKAHVTGAALYVDDVALPGDCLHVAVGGSARARARLLTVDLQAVRASDGVIDVMTAADIPGENEIGAILPGDSLLADQEVEYVAQPIFAVAALSLKQAQLAAAKALIEYEILEPELDVDAALAKQSFVTPSRFWGDEQIATIVGQSDHRIDQHLYIRGQEHFYLEPQAAYASPRDDGMFVATSSQHPGEVQSAIARVLGWQMHRVTVECRRMGGGFGGKESQAAPLACLSALFAQRNNKTVKYRMPRNDDMVQTGKRHDFSTRVSLGCDSQGILKGGDFELSGMCGYSPDLSDGIVDRAMFHVDNAYFLPSSRIVGHRCKTNTVSNTAFRGFGGPQGILAMEAAMDSLAYAAQIEPLLLRQRNLYRPGFSKTPYQQEVTQVVLPDLIERLAKSSDYWARREQIKQHNRTNPRWCKGISLNPVKFGISFTTTHLNQAGALVHIFNDGSVEVNHGGTEMGQGLYTKVQAVVANAFGLPMQQVLNTASRTDKVPNASPTAASSAADMNGMAALDACEQIKTRLTEFAQQQLGWSDALIFADGMVSSQGAPEQSLRFAEFVHKAYMARVSLSDKGFYRTPNIEVDKDAGIGNPFYYFANGASVSEVVVDTLTGNYRVTRVDILHDVGRSLNPAIDLGQIEGGFVQGMGWLTTEELLWDQSGRIISNGPANYKIPSAHDVPEQIHVDFYQQANPVPTVHRSKAVGEPPVMLAISVWCALRDACASLTGYRYLPPLSVPATAEQVYLCVQRALDSSPSAEE